MYPVRGPRRSRACRLPGSPFFKALEGRFALDFSVELTWEEGPAPAPTATATCSSSSSGGGGITSECSSSSEAGSGAGAAAGDGGVAAGGEAAGPEAAAGGPGRVTGALAVEVFVEVRLLVGREVQPEGTEEGGAWNSRPAGRQRPCLSMGPGTYVAAAAAAGPPATPPVAGEHQGDAGVARNRGGGRL